MNDVIIASATITVAFICLICVLTSSYYTTYRENREREINLLLNTV